MYNQYVDMLIVCFRLHNKNEKIVRQVKCELERVEDEQLHTFGLPIAYINLDLYYMYRQCKYLFHTNNLGMEILTYFVE